MSWASRILFLDSSFDSFPGNSDTNAEIDVDHFGTIFPQRQGKAVPYMDEQQSRKSIMDPLAGGRKAAEHQCGLWATNMWTIKLHVRGTPSSPGGRNQQLPCFGEFSDRNC